jgi:hypothetical protein
VDLDPVAAAGAAPDLGDAACQGSGPPHDVQAQAGAAVLAGSRIFSFAL